jgi:hypothetical protein
MHVPSLKIGWNVESLRLTFIGVEGWTQRQIFAEIAGVPADQINAQPKLHLHQETGNVGDAYLAVSQQADRIDIVLSDQPTRNTINPAAPDYRPLFWVGPLLESVERFDVLMKRAIPLVSRANRLAYAMVLVHQAGTIHEALEYLHQYLPTVDFDPETDLDLSFQINRPVHDGRGRMINRLAKWQAAQAMLLQLTSTLPMPATSALPLETFAQLYIDISTDANNTVPITGDELPALVDSLRDHAVVLAEKGDRK